MLEIFIKCKLNSIFVIYLYGIPSSLVSNKSLKVKRFEWEEFLFSMDLFQ